MAEAKGLLLLLLLVVRVAPLCSPARFIVLCHHVVYIVIFPSHVLAILGGALTAPSKSPQHHLTNGCS